MTWLAAFVFVLLGFAVFALAIGGVEPPDRIRTFGQSSREEQAFNRRAARLQMIGYASVALAVLIGLIGAFKVIH
jgi:hypothetical protein